MVNKPFSQYRTKSLCIIIIIQKKNKDKTITSNILNKLMCMFLNENARKKFQTKFRFLCATYTNGFCSVEHIETHHRPHTFMLRLFLCHTGSVCTSFCLCGLTFQAAPQNLICYDLKKKKKKWNSGFLQVFFVFSQMFHIALVAMNKIGFWSIVLDLIPLDSSCSP